MSLPVAIWAKAPVPGRVKTRLAVDLGHTAAAALARAFLLDVHRAVERCAGVHPVLTTTADWTEHGICPPTDLLWLQGPGSLGERLERVTRRALAAHPGVLHLGADSPGFPTAALVEAADALQRGEPSVLGRSADGGFWLLGLSRCPPGLFDALPWSTARTADAMLERLDACNMTARVVAPWFDVDTLADLERMRRHLRDTPGTAPHTAACLEDGT